MNILKSIWFLLFLLISNTFVCHASTRCGGAEFKTGEEYWEPTKAHYHLTVSGQMRERHSRYSEMELFDHMIEMDKNNELYCPIVYRLNCIEGVTLRLDLNPGGSVQLQLFLAFNESIVEILDTFSEIFNKAKYLRSDLQAMQDYSVEVLTFLKRAEHCTGYIFKGEKKQFDKQKFLKSLDNCYSTYYTEASVFNNQQRSWENSIKEDYDGIVTTEQYLNHYIKTYLGLFTNQYIFLKAHLRSYENKTRLQLDRKLVGGLKDFEYNLTPTNALNSLKIGLSENEEKKSERPRKKINVIRTENKNAFNRNATKKKNNRNQTTNVSSIKSSALSSGENQDQNPLQQQINISDGEKNLPTTIETVALPVLEKRAEAREAFQNSLVSQIPLVPDRDYSQKSNTALSLGKNENEAHIFNEISLNHTPSSEHIDDLSLSEELSKIKEQEKFNIEVREINQPTSHFQECALKIKEIDSVLNEFDGGPVAGMKTRKFLKLCESLNKLGYFSEFSANEKEVKIKTNNMVTVMHTNHSGNKKSPGITNNTANKLKEVIEEIQKK